jgi:Tfp pilus assembly protein PilF
MNRRHKKQSSGPRVPAARTPGKRGRSSHRPALVALGAALVLCLIGGLTALLLTGGNGPHRGATPARATSQPSTATTDNVDGSVVEWVNRGSQLIAQGRPAEAAALFAEALRLAPDDEDIHYNLGIALARQGKLEEAIQHYEEALRLFPDYVEAHNNLGNVLLRLGQPDEAVARFREAVRIMPDYASGWNNLGNALQHGQPDEASKCYQRAVELNPNHLEARFNLASSYARQRQFPEARAELEAVLRLQPDFAPARTALANLEAWHTNPPPVAP